MSDTDLGPSPAGVGRWFLGVATVACALVGLLGDARWFAASGALGIVWWGWDLVWVNVFAPLGAMLAGGSAGAPEAAEEPPALSTDDTIRLLEHHLVSADAPRHVQIQAALRLAELYRFSREDAAKADEVMRRIRDKYPDAEELRGVS